MKTGPLDLPHISHPATVHTATPVTELRGRAGKIGDSYLRGSHFSTKISLSDRVLVVSLSYKAQR